MIKIKVKVPTKGYLFENIAPVGSGNARLTSSVGEAKAMGYDEAGNKYEVFFHKSRRAGAKPRVVGAFDCARNKELDTFEFKISK